MHYETPTMQQVTNVPTMHHETPTMHHATPTMQQVTNVPTMHHETITTNMHKPKKDIDINFLQKNIEILAQNLLDVNINISIDDIIIFIQNNNKEIDPKLIDHIVKNYFNNSINNVNSNDILPVGDNKLNYSNDHHLNIIDNTKYLKTNNNNIPDNFNDNENLYNNIPNIQENCELKYKFKPDCPKAELVGFDENYLSYGNI